MHGSADSRLQGLGPALYSGIIPPEVREPCDEAARLSRMSSFLAKRAKLEKIHCISCTERAHFISIAFCICVAIMLAH